MAARVIADAVRVQVGPADLIVERGQRVPAGVPEQVLARLVAKGFIIVEPEVEPEAEHAKEQTDRPAKKS